MNVYVSSKEILNNIKSDYNIKVYNNDYKEKLDNVTFKYSKELITFNIINIKGNETLLKELVYTFITKEIAMVYYLQFNNKNVFLITNDILKKINLNISDLNRLAKQNSNFINIAILSSLTNAQKKKFILKEYTNNILLDFTSYETELIFCLSNLDLFNGSSVLFNHNIMKQISNIINDSYYVIMPSIHFCIILAKRINKDINTLKKFANVTSSTIDKKYYLTNKLFYYSKDKNVFGIVK